MISIHALVKRATTLQQLLQQGQRNFNPRPREEGDRRQIDTGTGTQISIHALVKRATDTYSNSEFIFTISIHALVKRATQ